MWGHNGTSFVEWYDGCRESEGDFGEGQWCHCSSVQSEDEMTVMIKQSQRITSKLLQAIIAHQAYMSTGTFRFYSSAFLSRVAK